MLVFRVLVRLSELLMQNKGTEDTWIVKSVDHKTKDMVQCFLGAFFLTFVAFIFVSFNRLWQAMSTWLQERRRVVALKNLQN